MNREWLSKEAILALVGLDASDVNGIDVRMVSHRTAGQAISISFDDIAGGAIRRLVLVKDGEIDLGELTSAIKTIKKLKLEDDRDNLRQIGLDLDVFQPHGDDVLIHTVVSVRMAQKIQELLESEA